MIDFFPRQLSTRALYCYLGLLAAVTLLFYKHAMAWYFYVIGLTAVYAFFHYVTEFSTKWRRLSNVTFEKKLFKTAVIVRIVYVIAVYLFYQAVTGTQFDFECGDVTYYHSSGVLGHQILRTGSFKEMWQAMQTGDFGDAGYAVYLSILYTFLGDSILLTRIVKAFLGGAMCVLVYKIAARNFDMQTGRLAGIMFMLMPNAIYYCGSHLKETEMVFLLLLFVERADEMLREQGGGAWKVVGVIALGCLLFFFRTALAVVLLVALGIAAVFMKSKGATAGKKFVVATVLGASVLVLMGTGIVQDITHEWDRRHEQEKNYEWRAERSGGNYLIQYATKAIFAPMMFTLPFPTMVDIPGQEHTQMCHGGNFVKNIISVFTILALIMIFLSGEWRKNVLLLAVLFGYLIVLAMSQFAQSERFHYPALPFVIMLAAYGVTHIERKHVKYFKWWTLLMVVAGIGWNYIKLKGRGM